MLIFKYWGKAKQIFATEEFVYHPLPFHCLDVAAVANVWWDRSPSIRKIFASFLGEEDQVRLKAWVLFFAAAHDFGKFDIRFQLKK